MNQLVRTPDKPLRQVANVRELLVNRQATEQLAKVAAKHLNPERMMRVMANAVRTTPKLGECEPMTLLGALMQCATMGLEPNTPMGHAYLIPFGKTVTLVVGYKGLADMARRSGQVVSLHSDVVCSDDELWSYEYGSGMHLRHKPGPREGKKVGAYCYAKLQDGEAFVFLPWAEVLKVRNASQGYKRAVSKNDKEAPWIAYEDAMARKTALRALANRGELPISVEFMQASEVDEAPVDFASFAQDPEGGPIIEGTAEESQDEATTDEQDAPPQEESAPAKPAQTTAQAAQAAANGGKPKEQPSGGQLPLDQNGGPTPNRRKELEAIRDKILQNAEVNAEQARSYHEEQGDIAALRAEAPDLAVEVENELAAFEKAQADRGEED